MGRSLWVMCFVLAAVLFGQRAAAVTPEFQITPRLGYGTMRIEALAAVNEDTVTKDTLGFGATAGYLTPIGVVAEVGNDSFGHMSFLGMDDSFDLSEEFIALGYQAELGKGWRLVPKVGRVRWNLESVEGALLNPGPEERTELKGYDYFWEVSVARRVSRVVTLGLSYRQGDYDFGRTRSTVFLVTLGF